MPPLLPASITISSLTPYAEWATRWHDVCLLLAWFVALVYLISGVEDLYYDLWAAGWQVYRRIRYAWRERLSLAKLRARTCQHLAVFVPAWQEGEVIGAMVENILHRVEYAPYVVFVGTYPNDPATQQAVDAIAARDPRVVKVVVDRPGPTNKAHCLNALYRAMQAYEAQHGLTFELMVMHDAEDVVHPHSFLLYNYLIPRVDVVQLPILPLPTGARQWVHGTYADEFAENHLKDVGVREKMGGFVPFAGVGTGFSRRALALLEARYGLRLFNETTVTEDYSMAKRVRDAGLTAVFANLVLDDDDAPWYVPLCRRPAFIANWSYFPMDFTRAVRQKTRWILGISLQEWRVSGWQGSWAVKENLLKDRKIFLAALANLLGYVLCGYFLAYELGRHGLAPWQLPPLFQPGTVLYTLICLDTGFMVLRLVQRMRFTGIVYGPAAALLSVPRLVLGNVLNGLAAFRAVWQFLQSWRGQALRWEKTEHREGVGALPAARHVAVPPSPTGSISSVGELEALLDAGNPQPIARALAAIPPHATGHERARFTEVLGRLMAWQEHPIRATVARVCEALHWEELTPVVLALLRDREWVVRANAARALVKRPDLPQAVRAAYHTQDRYAWDGLIRALEQDEPAQRRLLARLDTPTLAPLKAALLDQSPLLQTRYRDDAVAHTLQPAPE